ncbi:MAG: peptide chain release factor family protein [Myxococcales bacterium]
MNPKWHELSDEDLLAQCEVQAHRASGPGGQHRNKSETAIRLVHGPSGVSAEGKDERSRTQNLRKALARLREKLERRAYRPPPRRPTRPTKASTRKRVEAKRRLSDKKRDRTGWG